MNTYGYPQQQYPIGNNRPIYGTTATPVIQNNTTQRIRPVASLEEVRAMNIDFDGSVFYFPDYANRRIYTKQINMDGTASINMYEKLKKVLAHELTHAAIFSYDISLKPEEEELIADLVGTYGEEIINNTNLLFKQIKKIRE